MATIRKKVYKKIPGGKILTDISRGLRAIDLTTGPETPETFKVVQYGSDVTAQGLLDVVADLLANDEFINTETNGINELINEGVFDLDGCRFDIDIIISPTNIVRVGPGRGKFVGIVDGVKDANIYTIDEEYEFDVPHIVQDGYYRRDVINIVFRDVNNPQLVPYLEYICGKEVFDIPSRHYVFDKNITSTKSTYPLYSILYKNVSGNTTYQEHHQVYLFAGLCKTTRLQHTPAYMRRDSNALPGEFYGGFYASPTKYITFTDDAGNPLNTLYGSSSQQEILASTFYNIEEICQYDPTDKITFHEPDVEFLAPLEDGDPLTFAFSIPELVERYSPIKDIELRTITLGLNSAVTPEEGIEVHLYTAQYFVNDAQNGIINITNVVVNGTLTTITFDKPLNTLTQLTGNQIDFIPATNPVSVGDFIYVYEGQGQYQISKIVSLVNNTSLTIKTLPITLHTTTDANPSKILIFKKSTITLCGQEINTNVLANKSLSEQIDYETQYPTSTHTGISILPFNDTSALEARAYGTINFNTSGFNWQLNNQEFIISGEVNSVPFGPTTIILNKNCTLVGSNVPNFVTQAVNHINEQFIAAGINQYVEAYIAYNNYIGIRTTHKGLTQTITLASGGITFPDALITMGITPGLYQGADKYKPDIKHYYELPANEQNRLFYNMPNPPGTFEGHIKVDFPFKIRVNFNQIYFARISMLNRDIPYSDYGIRPQIVSLSPIWAATYSQTHNMTFNGYYATSIKTDAGLYGTTSLLKIEDEFGDITIANTARADAGYPAKYRLVATHLAGKSFKYPNYYNTPLDNEEDVAYVDVLNGIISFYMNENPAQMHYNYPHKIYLTYYYNNILSARLDTELIAHQTQAENNAIVNLWPIIEHFINPHTGQPRYGKPYEFTFTATSGQTEFIIPIRGDDIGSHTNMFLFVNGILQSGDTYTLSNHPDGVHGIIQTLSPLNSGDKVVAKIGLLDYPTDLRYSVPWEENFVATPGQREFVLSRKPDGRNFMALYVSGILVPKTNYTLIGNTIRLDAACSGDEIVTVKSWLPSQNVVSGGAITPDDVDIDFLDLTDTPNDYFGHAGKLLGVNLTETGITFFPLGGFVNKQDIFIANDGQTDFVLNGSPKDYPDGILCWIDGVFQDKTTFTFDPNTKTVTFDTPCYSGEYVVFMYMNLE